jgi:hypothetical protein
MINPGTSRAGSKRIKIIELVLDVEIFNVMYET